MIRTHKENPLWKKLVKEAPPQLLSLLSIAFFHGGFVAGGFARQLLTKSFFEICSGFSDIDIFFHSEDNFNSFINFIKLRYAQETFGLDTAIRISKGGNASGLGFHGIGADGTRCEIEIQMISARYGGMQQILEGFDLVNCQVAFDKDIAIIDDRIASLEMFQTIAINSWQNPLLLSRLAKYFNRHGYTSLVEEDQKKLVTWITDTFASMPEEGMVPGFEFLDRNAFASHLASVLRTEDVFTDEQLLMFFGILKNKVINEGYGTLVSIIKKSAEKTTDNYSI